MPRPIAISLSPNIEPDDVKRAFYARTHKSIWEDNQWTLRAEQMVSEAMDGHATALTSSGRQALFRLLKALSIGSGDEVIIQAFTCIAVPAPIIWTDAKPVYVDIDPTTYNLQPTDLVKKITPSTKAIIVQHTFGIPGPIEELKQIAAENNITLIEDCAHALGQTHNGQPLGTLADAAILSFGRDKIISSVFGGAVVSRNTELVERVREQQRAIPFPPEKWIRQQLLHPYIMDIVIPWYFRFALGKVWLVALQKLGLLSKAVAAEEKVGDKPEHVEYRYSPALAYLLVNQLEKLERFTQRRKEIIQRYAREFGDPNNALLRFPIQRDNAQDLIIKARSKKMLLGDWYKDPLAPSDCNLETFGYKSGSCPVAEEVGSKVLNLPTYPLMTDDQVEQVVAFVKHNS